MGAAASAAGDQQVEMAAMTQNFKKTFWEMLSNLFKQDKKSDNNFQN